MDSRVEKYLMDIKAGIKSIEEFIGPIKNFNEFQSNKILRRAIERELEIIGEAVNRILKLEPKINLENAKRIVSTRNHIIHAYDSVDDQVIWGIVINHLPKLEMQVANLLANLR